MKAIPKKVLIAAALVLAAVGYLASAGVKTGWAYYLTVDQFSAQTRYHNQRVKLCGTVAAEGLDVHRGLLTANFRIAGQGASIPVVYHGAIPDMFRQGAEVVVEGKLNDAGVFVADNLLTKCASKYDAQGAPSGAMPPMPAGHPALPRAS
jgi:cytochrome c-type biogenesis protein CcmE